MAHPLPTVVLREAVRAFLGADRVATIATVGADGLPNQAVVWYTLDGDGVVINSRLGRRWPTDLLRDPRISVVVMDEAGDAWVGLIGEAVPVRDQATAQGDIAAMARRYHVGDPQRIERLVREFEAQTRISFRIRVDAVQDHLED